MHAGTVLILAGQRPGGPDPLAKALGISHKCMTPVLGRAAIGYVAETVALAIPDAAIIVSVEREDVCANEPTLRALRTADRLRLFPARTTLLESVLAAAEVAQFPLVITTADNVLLTGEALRAISEQGRAGKAAAIVALAPREAILAAHPQGKGRYYEFRDGAFSNCNLFWLRSRWSLRAAQPFSTGGQFLKTKGRFLKAFGPMNAVLFASRRLDLKAMFARLSRRFKVRIEPLVFSDGRLAIDVDDLGSLAMVEDILQRDAVAA